MPDSLPEWTRDDKRDARHMDLMWVPDSHEAHGLVAALMPEVEAKERELGRKKARGQGDRPKLEKAVAATVADLLRNLPDASYRSLHRPYFAGQRIALDQFDAALKALIGLGYIDHTPTTVFPDNFGYKAEAARYRPDPKLVALAAEHGVHPETIKETFRIVPNTGRPKPPPSLIEMWTLRGLDRSRGRRYRASVTISPNDRPGQVRRERIERANAIAAKHDVRGCLSPVWKVVHASATEEFTGDWSLGGRWFAVGWGGAYWRLNEKVRADITIDGESVVEIDVSGSQISLLHGLLGISLPSRPYDFEEFPRAVIKQAIVQTLGNGRPLKEWREDVSADIQQYSLAEVNRVVEARFPFLADPTVVLPETYKGKTLRRKVLPHWLMGRESAALSFAIQTVWNTHPDALVMPVFDSLIVPTSLEQTALEALRKGYRMAGNGIEVELKRKVRTERGDVVGDDIGLV